MKFIVAASVVLLIIGSAACISPEELVQATNLARTNPKYYANLCKTMYVDKGILGVVGDLNCYQECVNVLNVQAPLLPLPMSPTANLAAAIHTEYMVQKNIFAHNWLDGTTPAQRLLNLGPKSTTSWASTENIAFMTSGATA